MPTVSCQGVRVSCAGCHSLKTENPATAATVPGAVSNKNIQEIQNNVSANQ